MGDNHDIKITTAINGFIVELDGDVYVVKSRKELLSMINAYYKERESNE
jgi:hypothetical protein